MTKKEILTETVEKINKKEKNTAVFKASDIQKNQKEDDINIISHSEKKSSIKGTENAVPLVPTNEGTRSKDNNYCLNSTNSTISISQTKKLSSKNSKNFKEGKNMFQELNKINMQDHMEKKNSLSYLSWTYAWAELKKRYPKATYKIKQFGENQLPYVYDENTGYMVFTEVTIEDITHSMWLPVMDSNNKAMKNKQYTYDTKRYKNIPVAPATMFDINKTIMRCLVKNLAMFGLGLYIYAGEDLPLEVDEVINVTDTNMLNQLEQEILKYGEKANSLKANMLKNYNVKTLNGLTDEQVKEALETIKNFKKGDK